MTKEEQILLRHFEDLSRRAYQSGRPCFTDFLDMNAQSLLKGDHSLDIMPVFDGGYEGAERKIAIFSEYETESQLCYLAITPVSEKFAEKLTHRDYLGSVLSVGLERSCIGDIIVEDKRAILICLKRVRELIMDELVSVKHTTVTIDEIDEENFVYEPRFELIRKTVASVRLDAVIGAAFNLSRSSACRLIESGIVFVNSRMTISNAASLHDGDIISVRHKGRVQLAVSGQKSKKDKTIIEIKKFI